MKRWLICMLAMVSLLAVTAPAGAVDMQVGLPNPVVIGTGANPTTIGFGGKQWVVIGHNGTGVDSAAGTMTLLLANGQSVGSNVPFDGTASPNGINKYGDAPGVANPNTPTLKRAMDAAYGSTITNFDERDLVSRRDLAGGSGNYGTPDYDWDKIAGNGVTNANFWPLSAYEARLLDKSVREFSDFWWLRSPGNNIDNAAIVSPSGTLDDTNGSFVKLDYAIRPAFKINLPTVLFTSAATDGKSTATLGSGLVATSAPGANAPVKLTVRDATMTLRGVHIANTAVTAGDTVPFTFNATSAGRNVYISCVLLDSGGNLLYYGKLLDTFTNPNFVSSFTLPAGLAGGTYTVRLFTEKANGDNITDFASPPTDIKLTVKALPSRTIGAIPKTGDGYPIGWMLAATVLLLGSAVLLLRRPRRVQG